ncbi:MAG: molybdenum cofactor biosynthesis protein MoaE [Clostridia bacterium]|nr:molybdenum cofactor biosynthesis protein MoaE [Clostridia bacterium]
MAKAIPSMDLWLKEAKAHESAPRIGMYLSHNGIVRESNKASVRNGEAERKVKGMLFSYDEEKLNSVIDDAKALDGIYYIRVWLNEGELKTGDDIMYVLIGGDIRPRVVDCLQYLVGRIKNECVVETEIYEE